ncbi:MAG: UDP-3-O-(3-hydroxymyristoyl)glucosamine N-acyltransferase [Hydrogenovibrio sp.]
MKLQAILEHLGAKGLQVEFLGDSSVPIVQVSSLTEAGSQHISFFSDRKRQAELADCQAGAVILKPEDAELTQTNRLLVDNPYYAYALTAQFLNRLHYTPAVHETAVIDPSVQLGDGIYVGAQAVIGGDVKVGKDCYIGAGSVIEEGVEIGDGAYIAPNVTLMKNTLLGREVRLESGCVIGGEGFGFANHEGEWHHIPQIGRVVVGDRVYVGNNTTINRGTIGDTVIESNCIIDCLVQIGHNVRVGYGTVVVSQVGIAGSTQIGQYCVLAGQTGVAGHIEIADHCHFAAKSGITGHVKEAGHYSGFPVVPSADWQKTTVRIKSLNKMAQKVKQIEKQLEEIKSQLENN